MEQPVSSVFSPTPAHYDLAARHILNGKLVAFPTETVYGLGADATCDRAVARIFAAKKRPRFNPLIIHLPTLAAVEKYAVLDPLSCKLAEKFWPGPLTLVLPKRPDSGLSPLVSAGLDTVAVRVPDHVVAQEILSRVPMPIAAPSANISGHLSPTLADHVQQDMGAEVAMILDSPPCRNGLESTIIQALSHEIRLLRPGSITRQALETLTRQRVVPFSEGKNPVAPGQLKSHYAPRTPVRLGATALYPGEALLAFGPVYPKGAVALRNLSPTGDLLEAAANLFALLHELDNLGCTAIAVSPIPDQELGIAINDRLTRAAAGSPHDRTESQTT